MTAKPKMVVGRLVSLTDREDVVTPLGPTHDEVTLNYQRHLAALIAAVYLFKEDETEDSLYRLIEAARAM